MSLESIEKSSDRALRRVLGLDDNPNKYTIGIIVAYANYMDMHNLPLVIKNIEKGIVASSCNSVVLPIAHTNSWTDSAFVLPNRELIADTVESLISTHSLDGVVLVGDDDIALAGLMMGAVRSNVPTIATGSGISHAGTVAEDDSPYGLSIYSGKIVGGLANKSDLSNIEYDSAGNGINRHIQTMACVLEAMGMTIPGNATSIAGSVGRMRIARYTGLIAGTLVSNNILPKMILTKAMFGNGLTALCAINGNLDATIHIIALAKELGITITFDNIASISNRTPILCPMILSSKDSMAFYYSGGMSSVLYQLGQINLMDISCITVHGKSIVPVQEPHNDGFVHTHSAPYHNSGCIAILKGNLAEDGALLRRTHNNFNKSFVGKARVFDSMQLAMSGYHAGLITKGDVVVVRFEGPKGSPGMRDIGLLALLLQGRGMSQDIAILTDGRLSFYDGIGIGYCSPEAALSSKLAIIKDGDKITIDLTKSKLELDINNKEFNSRLKRLDIKDIKASGWLQRYSIQVTNASKGCVLK